MADDVEEFIQDRGIRQPILIGHSMSVPARGASCDLDETKVGEGAPKWP